MNWIPSRVSRAEASWKSASSRTKLWGNSMVLLSCTQRCEPWDWGAPLQILRKAQGEWNHIEECQRRVLLFQRKHFALYREVHQHHHHCSFASPNTFHWPGLNSPVNFSCLSTYLSGISLCFPGCPSAPWASCCVGSSMNRNAHSMDWSCQQGSKWLARLTSGHMKNGSSTLALTPRTRYQRRRSPREHMPELGWVYHCNTCGFISTSIVRM